MNCVANQRRKFDQETAAYHVFPSPGLAHHSTKMAQLSARLPDNVYINEHTGRYDLVDCVQTFARKELIYI
jgi:hypothetical protein